MPLSTWVHDVLQEVGTDTDALDGIAELRLGALRGGA